MSLDTNIIIVGKTGHGKSTTGNEILGKAVFSSDRSPKPVTEKCQLAENKVNGVVFTVVDTPGLFGGGKLSESALEIQRSLDILKEKKKPAHVFLLLLSCASRLSDEEKLTIEFLRMTFGDEMLKRTIAVFTYKNELGTTKLEDFYKKCPHLTQIIKQCEGGAVAIDNKPDNESGHDDLLKKITVMKADGKIYDDNYEIHKKNLKDMATKEGEGIDWQAMKTLMFETLNNINEDRKSDARWKIVRYTLVGIGGVVVSSVARMLLKR